MRGWLQTRLFSFGKLGAPPKSMSCFAPAFILMGYSFWAAAEPGGGGDDFVEFPHARFYRLGQDLPTFRHVFSAAGHVPTSGMGGRTTSGPSMTGMFSKSEGKHRVRGVGLLAGRSQTVPFESRPRFDGPWGHFPFRLSAKGAAGANLAHHPRSRRPKNWFFPCLAFLSFCFFADCTRRGRDLSSFWAGRPRGRRFFRRSRDDHF